jgi:hypothetical protein
MLYAAKHLNIGRMQTIATSASNGSDVIAKNTPAPQTTTPLHENRYASVE